jgi:hypothetical protein
VPQESLEASLENLLSRPAETKSRKGSGNKFWNHFSVPLEPALEAIPAPTVPAPPKLNPDACDEYRFRFITKTWVAYISFRYPKSNAGSFYKTWKNPKKSKHFSLITSAAEKFIEHKLAPAAWIAFSCDMWHDYLERPETSSPPIKWVFDSARLDKWRGWARSETRWYSSKRVLYTKTYKTLLAKYSLMKQDLSRLPITAIDSDVEKVVDKYFPGDLYNELKKKIKAETARIQEILDDSLARGEWLWNMDWNVNQYAC